MARTLHLALPARTGLGDKMNVVKQAMVIAALAVAAIMTTVPAQADGRGSSVDGPDLARILAIGGHLHDNGLSLRFEDVATGQVIVELRPKLDPDGHVIGMPTQLPGVSGDGILVRAGRTYRVVARYNNPTSETLVNGAMGVMVALFAPDSFGQWPLVAAGRTDLAEDARGLAGLHVVGAMPLARADPRPR